MPMDYDGMIVKSLYFLSTAVIKQDFITRIFHRHPLYICYTNIILISADGYRNDDNIIKHK